MRSKLQFQSDKEELAYLRGVEMVHVMADEILEDCLERQLPLSAALDVFLSQCVTMVAATGGFLQLWGSEVPVLTRVLGDFPLDLRAVVGKRGTLRLDSTRSVLITQLDIGSLKLGAFGLVFEGELPNGGRLAQGMVEAMGEQLDTAVLAFLALAEKQSPLQRLDELNERAAFKPRGRIGKYEVMTALGAGGMAQVLVARAVMTEGVGRLVALKRILPHLVSDESNLSQFLDEARIGLRLNHQNLVTFFDFGQAGASHFIAMELLRGVDFDRLLYSKASPLPLPIVSAVVAQALDGMHAAHEARGEDGQSLALVHRDLSPHNLMCCFDGRVKVLDFGVAKAREQRTVTIIGTVKGKPLYMSPEQATGERLDRRSDLFAMGLILYEALSGTRAFDRGNDFHTMEAIVNDPLDRPGKIAPSLWAVVERALAKRPEDRFATAKQMAEVLRAEVPPEGESELGRLVSVTFPEKVAEFAAWDRASTGKEPDFQAKAEPAPRIENVTTNLKRRPA